MYKHLRLRLGIIIFLALFFIPLVWPYQDTPCVRQTVEETYEHGDLKQRKVLSRRVLSWPAYITSYAHDREERQLKVLEEEDLGSGRKKLVREIEIISKGLSLGLDLSGGREILYKLAVSGEGRPGESAQEVVNILRRRIDAYGLKEPNIVAQGATRIRVQLPGQNRGDIERIKSVIEGTGHLEFRLVASADMRNEWLKTGQVPEGYHVYPMEKSAEDMLISDVIQMTGQHIRHTDVVPGQLGEPTVSLRFDSDGVYRFAEVTGRHTGELLAIILNDVRGAPTEDNPDGEILQQGKLYSAPIIKQKIFGDASISGKFTPEEANDLKTTLVAGALPAKLITEHEYTVGPTLGEDTIHGGIVAVTVGLALVLIFMAVYYMGCGLVANVALCLNLLIILAVLSAFRATLTLPGMAGLILTAGMAVDANVLIFERMREEQERKRDKPLLGVLRDGYGRAFWTIFDANLTTVLTALILWWWGTGPVKGFGITLTIGIASSMFTALFVTRVLLELLVAKKWVKSFRMLRVIGDTKLPFIKLSRYAMIVSGVVVVGAIVAFFMRGQDNYDIDFSGGTVAHIALRTPMGVGQVKSLVGQTGYEEAIVQRVAGVRATDRTATAPGQSRNYEVRSRYVPQIHCGPPEKVLDAADQAYIGGLRAEVSTDRLVYADELRTRLRKTFPDAVVQGQGPGQDGQRFNTFLAMSNAPGLQEDEFRNAIEQALRQETLTADLRRVFGDQLMPDGFTDRKRDGDTAEVVMNLAAASSGDLSDDGVVQALAEQGYQAVPIADTNGAVRSFRISASGVAPAALEAAIAGNTQLKTKLSDPFPQVEQVGPAIAMGIRTAAIFLTVMAWLAMICYIWFRFHELRWGVAAVIALVHDVLITVGFLAFFGKPFNMPIIAALLTIIGYSINDTIVVFDRIRENRRLRREPLPDLVNTSVNQTLRRTILTSVTALVVLIALFIFGGSSIHNFAFAMIVGVTAGTYSSVFIAAPILAFGYKPAGKRAATARA